jgi:hypothetical protein
MKYTRIVETISSLYDYRTYSEEVCRSGIESLVAVARSYFTFIIIIFYLKCTIVASPDVVRFTLTDAYELVTGSACEYRTNRFAAVRPTDEIRSIIITVGETYPVSLSKMLPVECTHSVSAFQYVWSSWSSLRCTVWLLAVLIPRDD